MNKTVKTISRILIGMIILELIILPLNLVKAQQGGGIAVSGSFYRHHFKLLPGEKFSSPDVDIVIFNNYPVEIQVALAGETPAGVSLDLKQDKFAIPANSSITLPVGLKVENSVIPGEYEIGISADVLPGNKEGIAIAGSAQLRTKLTVYGEAGSVNVNVITQEGQPFAADVKIFQVVDNNLEPSAYIFGNLLSDRLIPGEYVVTANFEGTEVAVQRFTITANQEQTIDLKVNTAFVVGLTAVPQINDNKRIASAKINYTVKSVFQALKNVIVYLNVKKDGKLVEQIEMYTLPELALGSQDSRYTYIPTSGWTAGKYEFTVQINNNSNVQQAISEAYAIEVPTSATGEISLSLILLIVMLVLLALAVLYYQFRMKKK